MGDDLVDFLRQRIAEDEATARLAFSGDETCLARHAERHSPREVGIDCESRFHIVRDIEWALAANPTKDDLLRILEMMAFRYRRHPDFPSHLARETLG